LRWKSSPLGSLRQNEFMHFRNVLAIVAFFSVSDIAQLRADPRPMPTTQAQSLSGHEVILPSATTGHQAVIVIGFSHGSQKLMERWDKEIGAQVNAKPGVPLYNIAVLQDAPKLIRGMITHSMKALVPSAGQDHFLTVVEGQDELKKAVDFSDHDEAYVVVLDAAGKIVFHTHGEPSEAAKKQVIDQLKDD
jgi:hypothetical protein